MKKEAFWTFLEHKSEDTTNSQIMLETVPDGVTYYLLTASLVDEEVDNYFTLDAPERNLEVKE